MKFQRRNAAKGRLRPFPIDKTLIRFNRQGDGLSTRDLAASVLVIGDSGSGKTSGLLSSLAGSALSANASLVITCVKPEDAARGLALATRFGRRARIISLVDDRFNPLAHEQSIFTNDPTGLVERLTDQLLLPLRRQRREGSGGDPFWAADGARFVRHLVTIFVAAGIPLTYKLIYDTLLNLPTCEEDLGDEGWQRSCAAYDALVKAARRTDLLSWQQTDLDAAAGFLFRTAPNMPDRTRQSTVSTLAAALDPFVRGAIGQAINSDASTWDPAEVVDSPGVVIFDMPVQTAGSAAMTVQRMLLSAVQKAVLRRSNPTHPVMLLCDEYQEIMDQDDDPAFMRTARDRLGMMVIATQCVGNIRSARASSSDPRSAAEAILGLPAVKFFGATTDPETMRYASEVFTQTPQARVSLGSNQQQQSKDGDNRDGRSSTISRELQPDLPPHELLRLRRGGPENRFIVEAYCSVSGRIWRGTNRPSIKVAFPQIRL